MTTHKMTIDCELPLSQPVDTSREWQ